MKTHRHTCGDKTDVSFTIGNKIYSFRINNKDLPDTEIDYITILNNGKTVVTFKDCSTVQID